MKGLRIQKEPIKDGILRKRIQNTCDYNQVLKHSELLLPLLNIDFCVPEVA